MREHIHEVLTQIELDFDVKILFACESGSRAWGFPSMDSDYDIRFIYIHKKDWYLSIDQKHDVIEIPLRDSISIPLHNLLDIGGWELSKSLRLLRKSNPSLLEWLGSNVIYYRTHSTIEKIKIIANNFFVPQSCLYHYLNMAKGNFKVCLNDEEVNIKKYINVLRPILAAKWIKKNNSIPPVEFQTLFEDAMLEPEISVSIQKIIEQKMTYNKLPLKQSIEIINPFINDAIVKLEAYTKNLNIIIIQDPTEVLNQLFRETLDEVWGNS